MRKCIALFSVLLPGLASAQISGHDAVYWPKGTVYTQSEDIISMGSNGVLELRGAFPAAANFVLCRIDSAGHALWHHEIICTDAFGSIYPEQLIALPGNGFLVTGKAENATPAPHGFFAMRFDSAANLIWKKAYFPGGNYSTAGAVTLYDTANPQRIYFAWHTIGQSNPYPSGTTIYKTDLNGVILDTAFIALQNCPMRVTAGIINTSGNLMLAGGEYSNFGLIEVDTSLQVVQARAINSPFNGITITAMSEAATGHYMIGTRDGNYSTLWMRVDNTGHVEYITRLFTSVPDYYISCIERAANGDMYAIVSTTASVVSYSKTEIVHVNDTGEFVSDYHHRGGGANALVLCNDLPVVALQVTDEMGGLPVAYVQMDSAAASGCNSNPFFMQYYAPPTITENTPAANYYAVSPPIIYLFADSMVHTTTFNTIDYCILTEIEEQQSAQLSIWPVPAIDVLNVSGATSGSTCIVYDVSGNVVINKTAVNGALNIESLAPGYYILEVDDLHDHVARQPFIKQ